MATLHYQKANSDIAFAQSGSRGASQEGLIIGARSGSNPQLFSPDHIRFALGSGGKDAFGVFDHFVGAADPRWQINNTGTESIATGHGGILELATGTVADDTITVALSLSYLVSSSTTVLETRVQIPTALTAHSVEIGFSDALSETAGLTFSDHTLAGATAVATDAVIVAFDEAGGDANFNILSVNAGGTPQVADTEVEVAADTFYVIRVELASDGDARVYIDGAFVGEIKLAVATTAVLTPWVTVYTGAAAAATLNVDYLGVIANA